MRANKEWANLWWRRAHGDGDFSRATQLMAGIAGQAVAEIEAAGGELEVDLEDGGSLRLGVLPDNEPQVLRIDR